MPPVAAPTWWEDVQQEREDLAGRTRRPVESWLDEEVDFTPRRRLPRSSADEAVVLELDLERRVADEDAADADADAELHGVFVHAESARGGGVVSQPRRRPAQRRPSDGRHRPAGGLEPVDALDDLAAALAPAPPRTLDDERFLAPPPPDGARRTVHITGRPEQARAPLPSRRHRPRTTADRIGPRPDRLALYAVVLGIILILIALSSASPS